MRGRALRCVQDSEPLTAHVQRRSSRPGPETGRSRPSTAHTGGAKVLASSRGPLRLLQSQLPTTEGRTPPSEEGGHLLSPGVWAQSPLGHLGSGEGGPAEDTQPRWHRKLRRTRVDERVPSSPGGT